MSAGQIALAAGVGAAAGSLTTVGIVFALAAISMSKRRTPKRKEETTVTPPNLRSV